jgi:hypothetical protein
MGIRRIRIDEAEPVITGEAMCFAPADGLFVLRYAVQWRAEDGILVSRTFHAPLSRRELIAASGGTELADWLMARPGRWWRLPASDTKEGYAA